MVKYLPSRFQLCRISYDLPLRSREPQKNCTSYSRPARDPSSPHRPFTLLLLPELPSNQNTIYIIGSPQALLTLRLIDRQRLMIQKRMPRPGNLWLFGRRCVELDVVFDDLFVENYSTTSFCHQKVTVIVVLLSKVIDIFVRCESRNYRGVENSSAPSAEYMESARWCCQWSDEMIDTGECDEHWSTFSYQNVFERCQLSHLHVGTAFVSIVLSV